MGATFIFQIENYSHTNQKSTKKSIKFEEKSMVTKKVKKLYKS